MAEEQSQQETIAQQLALLKALADRPLTLPPIFVRITGSITAGLLLRQVLYWMGKTEDPEGYFWKKLDEFQDEMCMGEKEFRNARERLAELRFLESTRRGIPPLVYFRANLPGVLAAVQSWIRQNGKNQFSPNGRINSAERAESIPPNRQNQFSPNAGVIPPKGQKPNSAQKAESYKEAETTRDYGSETTGNKRPRPVSPTLMIAREKLAKYIERNQPDTADPEYDRKLFHVILAGRGGLTPTQAKEFLAEDPQWRKWPWLEHLDSQTEMTFPDPERKSEPVAEAVDESERQQAELVFEQVRDYVKPRISPHQFETWIKPLRPGYVRGDVLYLMAPTREFCHAGEKFADLFAKALDGQAVRSLVVKERV